MKIFIFKTVVTVINSHIDLQKVNINCNDLYMGIDIIKLKTLNVEAEPVELK